VTHHHHHSTPQHRCEGPGKAPRIMSKTDLSAMKIVTLVKEEALTTGGGFSLEKGVGMLVGHGLGGSLPNRRATS
jgi:hypothetical protein